MWSNFLQWAFLLQLNAVWAISLQRHDASFSPDYILRVTHGEAAIACRYRYSAMVNGSIPGPLITMNEGQTTWIRVYNDMTDSNLTMHWHGLSEAVSPWSDGTPQAAQFGIAPQHFFDYEVRPLAGEAGTYFYRSHVEFQAVSAAGPLIVEEASGSPPYQYDEERIFFVYELFNKADEQIMAGLTAQPVSNFVWSGEAKALLVNGQSYEAHSNKYTQTKPPYSTPPNGTNPICAPEVFEVEPNKTYRFRVIGASALSLVSFASEDHDDLTVIEVDGSYTKEASTDRVRIDSGQRFDFLFRAGSAERIKQLGKSLFWIQLESRYRSVNVTSYALLSYNIPGENKPAIPKSAPQTQPLVLTNDIQSWLEYTLEPLQPNNFPSAEEVTRTVTLTSAQIYTKAGIYWATNNMTWTEIDEHLNDTAFDVRAANTGVPYLVNIFKKGEAAVPSLSVVEKYGSWDPKLSVYVAEDSMCTPSTCTGAIFTISDLALALITLRQTKKKLKGYNPVLRDTTMLYKYNPYDGIKTLAPYTPHGWRAWRLRVTDAGVWMLHCHTLEHMLQGMQTVWVMGNASEITKHYEPYAAGYLTYGGSAYGNASFDPFVMHAYD